MFGCVVACTNKCNYEKYDDLGAADFSYANLTKINLSNSKIGSVNFTHANLTEAKMIRTEMSYAIFHKATLLRANHYKSTTLWCVLI